MTECFPKITLWVLFEHLNIWIILWIINIFDLTNDIELLNLIFDIGMGLTESNSNKSKIEQHYKLIRRYTSECYGDLTVVQHK